MSNKITKTAFRHGIARIYTDFLSFSFHRVYPCNPVYFKLIIAYPQHALRTTNNERRLMEIYLEFSRPFVLIFV